MSSKTLHLTLKKKWFNMILHGIKREEYREIKPYWLSRLVDSDLFKSAEDFLEWYNNPPDNVTLFHVVNKFDSVIAVNGYGKHRPFIKWDHEYITIGKPNPAWCEPEDIDKTVFILKIGNITESRLPF
jgi:hypothetical protein